MARSDELIGFCASVPTPEAHQALRDLGTEGLRDPRRSPRREGNELLIPVLGRALEHGLAWPVVSAATPANARVAPRVLIQDELSRVLPHELHGSIPERWQRIGDVVFLRLAPELAPYDRAVAAAVGTTLGARTVLAREGTEGELREPVVRHLWGDPDTRTVHREAGLMFHIDPARVLFSAGNVHERHRLVHDVTPGETVVDLFAGIGYFSLPLARAGADVVACEKNPVAAELLSENVKANHVAHRVTVREGDCRDVAPRGTAERVLVGYFPGTEAFVETAVAALRPGGGTIHVHVTASASAAPQDTARELASHDAFSGRSVRIRDARRVKWYAPAVQHVACDLEVRA